MDERDPGLSRMKRKGRKGRANFILNILIGVVILLILAVGATIIIQTSGDEVVDEADKESEQQKKENTEEAIEEEDGSSDELSSDEEDASHSSVSQGGSYTPKESNTQETNQSVATERPTIKNDSGESSSSTTQSVVTSASEDDIVEETIINPTWEPIGTSQTGTHVSLYDGESVDWKEKKQALSYAVDIPEEQLYFLKIKNGGSPQKSIGIISTKDQSQKYRVYIDWIDGEGWKPVKVERLKTLDFEY